MGELTPVLEVDGRIIGAAKAGPMTEELLKMFWERTAQEGELLPF